MRSPVNRRERSRSEKSCSDVPGPVGIAMAALVDVVGLFLFFVQASGVAAVFSAEAIGSDVAIFTHNDLYGSCRGS